MQNFRLLTALLLMLPIHTVASASDSFQQPMSSLDKNRAVDQIMPPLSTRPALTEVLSAATADSKSLSLTASMGYTKVPAEFKQYMAALANTAYPAQRKVERVSDELAFLEMKRYLFNRYNGLTVLRTIQQDGKQFDCILRSQQPGLRDGRTLAEPPALVNLPAPASNRAGIQTCEAGTVPLERLDIAALMQHPTLEAFLHKQKAPLRPLQLTTKPPANSANGHYYSVAFFDTASKPVTGAGTVLNTWDPALRSTNETQSISQIWLGGMSSQRLQQTVEVGWEEQPGAGWGNKPIVFIYSTQDGYNRTGCHNLDCSDFVQTSSTNVLGATPPGGYSVSGGAQKTLAVEYQRNTDGNWWVRINGEWIGYYKASLYSGDLATGSAAIDFSAGGETSTANFAPSAVMGSGQLAAAGYKKAAFQANHFYRDENLNTIPAQRISGISVDNPACYTMAVAGYSYTAMAGVTKAPLSAEMTTGGFYFGGPGCL